MFLPFHYPSHPHFPPFWLHVRSVEFHADGTINKIEFF